MDVIDKLKSLGWYLTNDGFDKLSTSCDKSNTAKIIQEALDIDFRDIANGALPSAEALARKELTIPGRIVLQIMKVRNISSPKIYEYEESKNSIRLLQIDLTDGVNTIMALELEHISALSTNTPPGTKIYFKCDNIDLIQGMIILKPTDIQVLGGKVIALIEKWEMARSLQKYARGGRIMGGISGPPRWTAFGEKIKQNATAESKNFKSLAPKDKDDKDAKENNDFNAMRSEAIAEAAKASLKKTFGGGNQQIVDHNLKKILEKGYSEDDAKHALKLTRNNLEHALYNLKRKNDIKDEPREKAKSLPPGKRNSKDLKKSTKEDSESTTKPATNMSLFDFLTDKLPANTEQEKLSGSTPSVSSKTAEYQVSSKFESNRPERTRSAYDSNSTKAYYNTQSNPSHSSRDTHQPQYRDRNQGVNIPNNHSQQSGMHQPLGGQQQRSVSNSGIVKFENNISSSFASRNSTHSHDERNFRNSSRSGSARGSARNNDLGGHHGNKQYEDNSERYKENSERYKENSERYKENSERYKENSERYKENSERSKDISRQSSSYNRNDKYSNERTTGSTLNQVQPSSSVHDNRKSEYRRNDYQQQPQKNDYQQQPQKNDFDKMSRGGHSSRYPPKENATLHQTGPGRNYNETKQSYNSANSNTTTASYSNDHSNRVKKLTDDTSKMSIDKSRSAPSPRIQNQSKDQPPQQRPQQQPQQQPHQQPNQVKNQQAPQPPPHQQKQLQQQQPIQPQQSQLPQQSHQQSQPPQQSHQQSQPQPQQQYQHPPQIVSHHYVGHHPSQTILRHQQPQPQPQQLQNQQTIVPSTTQQSQSTGGTQPQPSQSQTTNHAPPHHVLPAHSSFAQLPNGFTYDPNKIIGFQNKETNEFALTLLKSQGITAVAATQPTPMQAPQLVAPTIGMAPHPQFVPAASIQLTTAPFTPGTTFVVSQAPPQAAYGITGENWNWKIGDRCMAKYWDDGRFYEAEITGVSDKTCVVFFSGYGNHEEVLKSDCAPLIIDGSNWSFNYARPSSMPPPSASSVISRGVPNRFRGERQVYVPPQKRHIS